VFTAQNHFDDIFSFTIRKFEDPIKSEEKRQALFRRFSGTSVYTHGYILELTGRYLNRKVRYALKSTAPNEPGNFKDFLDGRFDIKFEESIKTIEEAKAYVYEDDYENLYEKEDEIYLRKQVDINHIFGGIICEVNFEKCSFWVYNKNWNQKFPDNLIPPKNINSLDKKLQEKYLEKLDPEDLFQISSQIETLENVEINFSIDKKRKHTDINSDDSADDLKMITCK
jgi:hypothetical protein